MYDERKVVILSDDDDKNDDDNSSNTKLTTAEENAEQQQQEDKYEPSTSSSNNIALDISTQQHERFQAAIPLKGKTKVNYHQHIVLERSQPNGSFKVKISR